MSIDTASYPQRKAYSSHIQIGKHGFGHATSMEAMLDFMVWACQQHTMTPDLIQRHLNCSRATSYRYLHGWECFCSKHGDQLIKIPRLPDAIDQARDLVRGMDCLKGEIRP